MTKTASIDALLARLAAVPATRSLGNPFADSRLAGNLKLYLNFLAARPAPLALIGEAAGHRGCALTGMPFTSPETLRDCPNAFFASHRERMFRQGEIFEQSGRYVWGVADAHGIVPLLWNALPFHPHQPGKPRSNRTPTNAELEMGEPFLTAILDIFTPSAVVAVGKKAEQSLRKLYPGLEFTTVRHPAMGGSTLFKAQMAAILKTS
ncbi:uracil-DNA glycosylase [Fundidesulfovibrio terrae]|uniref:uracil-DNA glycosylase n=1 Tax=Fundidesulfovibrio terrae TaxID=2922866 RepID=UPI001FAF198B|nr:uracil-DNA glycosylase [Fundidesulfovibrio terrae]